MKRKDRAAEIANTFEWLITAFVLAFVFRAFVMEAFRIPTGSMADTLKGAHFRLCCPQCGHEYDHGFVPQSYGQPQDTIPPGKVRLRRSTRCPSCGYYLIPGRATTVANGDRILVLKCIYQFFEPKQWDVVVFKNPLNPSENYIKRLIGLPGEQVEIIDGDIYINGEISRKPPKVQKELWMLVYDNDYRPVNSSERLFNHHKWYEPFDFDKSNWQINTDNSTEFQLDCPRDQVNMLTYGAPSANDFEVAYSYNDVDTYNHMPYCSDLMMRFYVQISELHGGIGIGLGKYDNIYKAWIDFTGQMVITKVHGQGQEEILNSKQVAVPTADKPTLVKFANVDHQLIFQFGTEKLVYDIGCAPDAAGQSRNRQPKVQIFGSGKLTLSHIAIFRDIHYTGESRQNNRHARAVQGNPFTLGKDEFFVMGDNSPNSEDGRWWAKPDSASKGCQPPRAGVVPRDYLVGKAMFVYWPSGFEFLWPENFKARLLSSGRKNLLMRAIYGILSLRWIPNVGEMRFIYGGSNKKK